VSSHDSANLSRACRTAHYAVAISQSTSSWSIDRLQFGESRPIAKALQERRASNVGIIWADEMCPSATSSQHQIAVGQHFIDNPKLVDKIVVVVPVFRRVNFSCARARMGGVFYPTKHHTVARSKRTPPHARLHELQVYRRQSHLRRELTIRVP
jgi:hypothetical protein